MSNDELKGQAKALFSDAVDNVFSEIKQELNPASQKKFIELIEEFENRMDEIIRYSD